jgi:hypothetical protein
MATAKKTAEVTSFRWNESDRKIIEKVQRETGITSVAEILRMALRALERERSGTKLHNR